MAVFLRRAVSTNKVRYQKDGFDLDLTYITPRIIAMGFPCDGISGLYRNPMGEAARFLQRHHAGHFRVYNLCIERGYSENDIGGSIVQYPLYDGQAPPLHIVHAFCSDAVSWLGKHPSHVVVIHCKAGKGRTGALTAALLMHQLLSELSSTQTSQHTTHSSRSQSASTPAAPPAPCSTAALTQKAPTPPTSSLAALTEQVQQTASSPAALIGCPLQAALTLYNTRRTRDGKGLTIPSQIRYVRYYHLALTQHGGSVPQVGIRLTRVHISGLPVPLARDCTVSIWLRPPGSPHTLLLLHAHTSGLAVQSVQHEQVGKPCSQAISVQDACSSRPSLLGSVNATCSLWKGTHNTTASALCTAPNTKGLNTGKHGMSKSAALDVVLHGWRSSQEFPVTHGSAPACSRVWLGNLCMGGLAEPNVHAERPAVQGATGVHALEASASARVHVAEHSGMTGSQSRGRSVQAAANTLSASSTDKPAGAECTAGAPWASGTAKGLCKSDSGVELAGCLKVQVFKGRYSDEHSGVFKGGSTQLGAWMHTAFMRPGQRSHLTCRHGGTIDTRRSDASTGLHGSCVSPGVRGGGKQGLQADAYVTKQEGKGEAGSEEESARGASCCMVLEQDELDKVAKPLRPLARSAAGGGGIRLSLFYTLTAPG